MLKLVTHGRHLLAKIYAGSAEHLAQPNHLCAEIGAGGRNSLAIFADTIGKKTNLATDLVELPDDLFAHGIDSPANPSDRLKHKFETGTKLLHYGSHFGHHVVRHAYLPLHDAISDILPYQVEQPQPAHIIKAAQGRSVISARPINEHRPSFDSVPRDSSPETAIVTPIPVIAHHEILVGRDLERAKIVTLRRRRSLIRCKLEM